MCGIELGHGGAFDKSHIVLVCRDKLAGIDLRGLLYKFEKRQGFLLAVDDERTIEYLVTAVLAVDLREAEHLTVSERTAQTLGQTSEIFLLLDGESKTLALVVFGNVADILYGRSLAGSGKDTGIKPVIETGEHLVKLRLRISSHTMEFLNAGDALDSHILGDFHCVGAPRCDHLLARADETAFEGGGA